MTGDISFIMTMIIDLLFFVLGIFALYVCIENMNNTDWWVWLIAISIIVLSIIACYQVLDNTIHSEITKEKAFYHNKKDYSNKKAIIVIDDISYEVDIKKLSNDSFCVKHVNRYNILGELKETYYKICECNIKGKAIPIEL